MDVGRLVDAAPFAGRLCFILQWPRENGGQLILECGGELRTTAREGGVVSMSTTAGLEIGLEVKVDDFAAMVEVG